MNIGQLPPFLIWPYALYCLLTNRSLFFMLEVLSIEQKKYLDYYDGLEATLQGRMEAMFRILEYTPDTDGLSVLFDSMINAIILPFDGVFLAVLKIYILIRHLNYAIFSVLFYVGSIVFNQGDSRGSRRHATLD